MSRRRRSRPIAKKLGRSERAPFIPGEPPMARHDRRRRIALQDRERALIWAKRHRCEITFRNDGHHWIIRSPGRRRLAEWWPSSARLVLEKAWDRCRKAHDWSQVARHLSAAWKLPG